MHRYTHRLVVGTPIACALAGLALVYGPPWVPEATILLAFVALAYSIGAVLT
jgi:hypothetical protein